MCSVGVNTEKLTTNYTDGVLSGTPTTPKLSSGAPTCTNGVFSGAPTTSTLFSGALTCTDGVLSEAPTTLLSYSGTLIGLFRVLSAVGASNTGDSVVGDPLRTPSVQVGAPLDSFGVVSAPLDSFGVVSAPLDSFGVVSAPLSTPPVQVGDQYTDTAHPYERVLYN
ncbi:unnamed protein product [Rotaria socialis]